MLAMGVVLLLAIALVGFFVFPLFLKEPENNILKIGVCVYSGEDTFISGIMEELDQEVKEYEKKEGIKINLDISSAGENQRTQNEQVERYISLGYDVLCINLVDRTNGGDIIDMAITNDIPLVFFNREPVEEDILRSENFYYVGSNAKQTAILQGEIVLDYWNEFKEVVDKNENDTLEYIMLEGEAGHQDTIFRSNWSVETLEENNVKIEKLKSDTANWDRSQAAALIEQWYGELEEEIEFILCNNDDMALGAADALEKLAVDDIPIVGIDATSEGRQAVRDGRIIGTVDCNIEGHAEAIFKVALALGEKKDLPEDIKFEKDNYVRIELKSITE